MSLDVEKMAYALDRAAEQFEFYAVQHRAKNTDESLAKAFVNDEMAAMCRDALKVPDRVMDLLPESVRPEPDCDYEVRVQQEPGKVCQSYATRDNGHLSMQIINHIAPHWSAAVRNAAGDSVRAVLNRELTRMWTDVVQFHHKFKRDYAGPPRVLPDDLAAFRIKFMQEELDEYKRWEGDIRRNGDTPERRAELLDALVDLVYVALGTAYLHGFNFAEAWRRVQRANMAKTTVGKGVPTKRGFAEFDVVKPPGWTPPNHLDLVGEESGTIVLKQHDLF